MQLYGRRESAERSGGGRNGEEARREFDARTKKRNRRESWRYAMGKSEEGREEGRGKEVKLKTVVVCVLSACVATGLLAAEQEASTLLINQGWGSGQTFLSLAESVRAGIASGIVSGLFLSPLMGAPERGPEILALAECTRDMTPKQLGAIVEKYLRDHPEKWHDAIAVSTVFSLRAVCPRLDDAMSVPTAAPVIPPGFEILPAQPPPAKL
jgi:hypothetical protein